MNRVAPIVPFTGAFIATCKWSYRRSMLYLVIGGAAKYGFLLTLVGFLQVNFNPETAQLFTIIALFLIIGISFISSWLYKKRLERDGKAKIYKNDYISQTDKEKGN